MGNWLFHSGGGASIRALTAIAALSISLSCNESRGSPRWEVALTIADLGFDVADNGTIAIPSADRRNSIIVFGGESPAKRLVVSPKQGEIFSPHLSNDGRFLAFELRDKARSRSGNICVVDLTSNSTRSLSAHFSSQLAAIADDGLNILVFEREPNLSERLWNLEIESGARLALSPPFKFGGAAAYVDGGKLVFSAMYRLEPFKYQDTTIWTPNLAEMRLANDGSRSNTYWIHSWRVRDPAAHELPTPQPGEKLNFQDANRQGETLYFGRGSGDTAVQKLSGGAYVYWDQNGDTFGAARLTRDAGIFVSVTAGPANGPPQDATTGILHLGVNGRQFFPLPFADATEVALNCEARDE